MDDSEIKSTMERSCCAKMKQKFLKVKENRDFLRNALHTVEPKMIQLQSEKISFMKSYESEKARAESEKEAREKELSIRDGLEKEILRLKCEIEKLDKYEILGEENDDSETVQLRVRVSELEGEVYQLKELLEVQKRKESSVKCGLENEIVKLKSEITLLKERRDGIDRSEDGEVKLLRTRVLEREAEIKRLNELFENEQKKGNLEMKKIQAEKRKVEEALKVEAEARLKESSAILGLENEILDLKTEVASLVASRDSNKDGETSEIAALKTHVSEAQTENIRLKELLDKEKKKFDSEKKKSKVEKKKAQTLKLEAEAELKKSAGLETEILTLKSEIALLQKKLESRDQDESSEALVLKSRVTKAEAEIQKLNELVKKERNKGESERKKAEIEQRRASDAWNMVKSEKNRADASHAEVSELKAKLVSEKSRIEVVHKTLEAEIQLANREKKRADVESEKAEEQKKCYEEEKKKLMNEKNMSSSLSQKLEEYRQKNVLLEKELQEMMLSGKMKEAPFVTSDVSRNSGEDLMFLEKHLKLEKLHAKHAKRVAKFEKSRSDLLEQELYHLKQDFSHFGHRLNALDGCFSKGIEGIDASRKVHKSLKPHDDDEFSGKELLSFYGRSRSEVGKASYISMDGFDRVRSTLECSAPFSDENGSSTKPISGINSSLESLIGGSLRNELPNSAIFSTSTSFSDRPSLGSQETNNLSVPRTDSTIEDLRKGSTVAILSAGDMRARIDENLGLHENSLVPCQIIEHLHLNQDRNDDTREDDRVIGVKRKRSPDVVESFKSLPTELTHVSTEMEENQNDRNSFESRDGRCSTACLMDYAHARNNMSNKKGKVSLTPRQFPEPSNPGFEVTGDVRVFNQTVSHDKYLTDAIKSRIDETVEMDLSTETSLDNMTGEAILKLLELDDPDDEERFKMAMERPLSPTLPELDMPTMDAFKLDDISNVRINESNNSRFLSCSLSVEMETGKHPLRNEMMDVSKYFVVFPNMEDRTSISKIISACQACISSSSIVSSEVWLMEEILVAVEKQEDLISEEKACLFFSLLLHNFLSNMPANFTSVFADDIHSCWNSFLRRMKTVMSDAELRNKLLKLFHLDILLNLIESFILHKRILSYQPTISSETASTDTLVAASFILASICMTTGQIGYLCEASYELLGMCRSDTYSTLTMLHVFALVCGSAYLNLRSHSLLMSVIGCIVTLVEREIGLFHPCAECVFSKDVEVSVDKILSLLLGKLPVAGTGNKPLNDVSDVISLVELLAFYMGWEWTHTSIIPHLLKIVNSCLQEETRAAVVLLIGQLGRFGIDESSGSEQFGVEELRRSLAALLDQRNIKNWTLPTEFAIIDALTGLSPLKFQEVVRNDRIEVSQHANLIRAWYTELNQEEKALSLGILV